MSELVPFFSIVIPTYNRSRLVTYAIDSVLKQTFGDFEIVVCDNGSADDTPDVVRRITDPRVRYVRTPRHMVIADNWEFARSHARGRMVLMLSDDDALVRRLRAYRSARHVRRGDVKTGFRVSGGDFRFYSIVGCAEFLGSIVLRNR